jgi:hypothetical protein
MLFLFIYFTKSQSVFALGNPVIADLIDKNYYIGPWAIARDMCKVEKEYPSIRAIAPQLFVWDKELPETAFWWSTMAVCHHYLHIFICIINKYWTLRLMGYSIHGKMAPLAGQNMPQTALNWLMISRMSMKEIILNSTVARWHQSKFNNILT